MRTEGGASAKSPRSRVATLTTDVPIDTPVKLEAMVLSRSNMDDSFISLRGLPNTAVLSTGIDAGGGQWLVRPRRLKDLITTLPKGMPSDFRLEILLLTGDVGADISGPSTLILQVGPAL